MPSRLILSRRNNRVFYDHPLATPKIYPDDFLPGELPVYSDHKADDNNVVLFGMIDCVPSVKAKTLIYDSQNSRTPQLLSQMHCSGEQVIYVLNAGELSHFYKSHSGTAGGALQDQARWLLDHERVECVVVKCGAQGAYVCVATLGLCRGAVCLVMAASGEVIVADVLVLLIKIVNKLELKIYFHPNYFQKMKIILAIHSLRTFLYFVVLFSIYLVSLLVMIASDNWVSPILKNLLNIQKMGKLK